MSTLAMKGGKPVREKPFSGWPVFDDMEVAAVTEVVKSGKWWYGEKVKEFEGEYAAFQDARFGITCTNGTAALEMCLLACGVGAGDEVIVPPYTFIATASAVLRVNAVPIFADIELDTCNLDPKDAEKKITDKTKAVIPTKTAYEKPNNYECHVEPRFYALPPFTPDIEEIVMGEIEAVLESVDQ